MSSIKEDTTAYAMKIGLDLVGVTTIEPFDRLLKELDLCIEHYRPRYEYRFEQWRKFANPTQVLPDAKSVLVVGFNYLAEETVLGGANGRMGRIVSYGHLGILKRARLMVKYLRKCGYKAEMGANRKEAAVRAGLGMIGKNNLVCNSKYGSWTAFQTIVTDAEMEPDKQFASDLCGNCRICMEKCPTGALYEPHRVDPRRCVTALLTSKEIPEEYWPKMGTRILGCDSCLEACPKNKDLVPKKGVEGVLPDNMGTQPSLKRLLSYTDDSFQDKLVGTVVEKMLDSRLLGFVMRNRLLRKSLQFAAKFFLKGKEMLPETFVNAMGNLPVYKRNALIAAGNLGDVSMLEDVKRFTDDPYLGKYARWAAGRLEGK